MATCSIFRNFSDSVDKKALMFIGKDIISDRYKSEIIKLSQLNGDSNLIGHIYGGIYSPDSNPFTNNNTAVTNAHAVIYEVWILKDVVTKTKALQGNNPLKVNVFPNPSKHDLTLSVLAPYAGDIDLLITNAEGKLLVELEFDGIPAGVSTLDLGDKLKLPNGLYNLWREGFTHNAANVVSLKNLFWDVHH